MKDIFENIFGFIYTLSMGDYLFFIGTLLILVAFLYMIYLIKREENVNNLDEISTIESIKESIEKDYKPESIVLTDYEKEQEDNAIISYDELINNKNKISISYDDEYVSNTTDVLVKKININNSNSNEEYESDLKVRLMSYDKEEAFLEALKKLQQNLLN